MPALVKRVIIRGKANIAMPKMPGERQVFTPLGKQTIVSDDDLAFLETNRDFKSHVKRALVTVIKAKTAKPNVDKVVRDMQAKDGFAPHTDKSIEDLQRSYRVWDNQSHERLDVDNANI